MTSINAGNKGLCNLGNTCYMNSALQCLSHLLTFHPQNTLFYDECGNLKDCLMKEWFEFQREMWSNDDRKPINPIKLLKCFQMGCQKNNYYFSNFAQNDVDEFLILFFDLLHQGIKKSIHFRIDTKVEDEGDEIIKKSYVVWKRFYEKDYSYIVKNFYSQLLSLTNCPLCDYYTSNHDPIQVISLGIPDDATKIEHCLDKYTQRVRLDSENKWRCDKCSEMVQSNKKTLLWRTSDVVIILLKRFKDGKKINRHLSYPLHLDMKDYNLNYGTTKSNQFVLQSFAVHSGTLNGGHYFAVCRNQLDKKWYEYNDTNVTELKDKKVTEYIPYLFFYKRA